MTQVSLLIYIVSFIDLFAVGLFVPLLPLHIHSLGASYTTIGLFSSLYSALQVLTGPLIGSWSDARGRQYVAKRTLLLCCICYLLIGFTKSVFPLLLLRFILGLVKHTQTLLKAIIGDCSPMEKQTEVLGFSSAIGSLGFVVGPIIGGHLYELMHGFQYVSLLTAFLFLINIGFVSCLHIPSRPNAATSNIKSDFFNAVKDVANIEWHIYWETFLLRFLFGFAISVYFSNQVLYLQSKYVLSQKSIGYLLSFASVISSGSGLLLGFITSRFYAKECSCFRRLFDGFIMLSGAFIALHLASNVYLLVIVLVPFGVSNAILRIVSMEVILAKCKTSERGSLAGAVGSVMSVSRFISPILSGIVIDYYGEQSIIYVAFIPSLIGTILCSHLLYKGSNILHKKNVE